MMITKGATINQDWLYESARTEVVMNTTRLGRPAFIATAGLSVMTLPAGEIDRATPPRSTTDSVVIEPTGGPWPTVYTAEQGDTGPKSR